MMTVHWLTDHGWHRYFGQIKKINSQMGRQIYFGLGKHWYIVSSPYLYAEHKLNPVCCISTLHKMQKSVYNRCVGSI